MRGHKIFLTRSFSAAAAIARGLQTDFNEYTNPRVGHGSADARDDIPRVYHNKGYFYAQIEFDSDVEYYKIEFC